MTSTSAVPAKPPSRALGVFAWTVVGYNILVILWGAVVRTTGSGAGCGAAWPLCNGDFFPHHPRLATIIEFAHRSMSGVCTFLVLALAVWTFKATRRGDRTRRAVMASVFFLVTEALLGAALVLRRVRRAQHLDCTGGHAVDPFHEHVDAAWSDWTDRVVAEQRRTGQAHDALG